MSEWWLSLLSGEHGPVPSGGRPGTLGSPFFWWHLLAGQTLPDLSRHQDPLEGLRNTHAGARPPESAMRGSWCGAWAPGTPHRVPGDGTRPGRQGPHFENRCPGFWVGVGKEVCPISVSALSPDSKQGSPLEQPAASLGALQSSARHSLNLSGRKEVLCSQRVRFSGTHPGPDI